MLKVNNNRDWLDIVGILVIPITALIITFYLGQVQMSLAQVQHNTDQQIAQDNRYEDSLNAYRNSILTLLIDKNLRNVPEGSEVRDVAHSLTHDVTRRLDDIRKGQLVRFLSSNDLIRVYNDPTGTPQIPAGSLAWVDLSEAHLEGGPILDGADLRAAILLNAKVTPDQLSKATLLAGATLPDGTKCSVAKNWRDLEEEDQIKQNCVTQYKQHYDKNKTPYSIVV